MDVNLNSTAVQCLKTTNELGAQIVTNICNGQTYTIPWGTADWLTNIAAFGILTAIGIGFVCFMIAFAVSIVRDM